MWNKPFKLPLLRNVSRLAEESSAVGRESSETGSLPPPFKKRRILVVDNDATLAKKKISAISPANNASHKPLLGLLNPVPVAHAAPESFDGHEGYYLVLW